MPPPALLHPPAPPPPVHLLTASSVSRPSRLHLPLIPNDTFPFFFSPERPRLSLHLASRGPAIPRRPGGRGGRGRERHFRLQDCGIMRGFCATHRRCGRLRSLSFIQTGSRNLASAALATRSSGSNNNRLLKRARLLFLCSSLRQTDSSPSRLPALPRVLPFHALPAPPVPRPCSLLSCCLASCLSMP